MGYEVLKLYQSVVFAQVVKSEVRVFFFTFIFTFLHGVHIHSDIVYRQTT